MASPNAAKMAALRQRLTAHAARWLIRYPLTYSPAVAATASGLRRLIGSGATRRFRPGRPGERAAQSLLAPRPGGG